MYSQPNRIKYAFDVTCAGATSEFAIRGPKGKSGKPWDWGVEGVTTALTSACTVAIGTTADPDAYGEEFAVGGTAAEDAASVRNTYLPNAAPRLRRPAGGYRYTIASGVMTQEHGTLTGSLPGGVLDSTAQ